MSKSKTWSKDFSFGGFVFISRKWSLKVLWIFFFFTGLSVQEYLEEKIIARDLIEEFDREDSLVFEPQFVHNICEIILEKGEKKKTKKPPYSIYFPFIFSSCTIRNTLYNNKINVNHFDIFSTRRYRIFFFFLLNFENTRKYWSYRVYIGFHSPFPLWEWRRKQKDHDPCPARDLPRWECTM